MAVKNPAVWQTAGMMTDAEMWLQSFLRSHGGVAGTVHVRQGDSLVLHAAVNIPPQVLEVTRHIPNGKGMAGLALSRNQPVQTCNLKDDSSGDVRPGAKAVNANAAVALPVHDGAGEVRAVVGIAFMGEREIPGDELARLSAGAQALPAAN